MSGGKNRSRRRQGSAALAVFLVLLCLCTCSCGKEESELKKVLGNGPVNVLWQTNYEDGVGSGQWGVLTSKTDEDGIAADEEAHLEVLFPADLKTLREMKGLETFRLTFGPSLPDEERETLMEALPEARVYVLSRCTDAELTVLGKISGMEELHLNGEIDLETLPETGAKAIWLSNCLNIPWKTIASQPALETIVYNNAEGEIMRTEVLRALAGSATLRELVYFLPVDLWDPEDLEARSDSGSYPLRIESPDEVPEWLCESLDAGDLEVFLSGGRSISLYPGHW